MKIPFDNMNHVDNLVDEISSLKERINQLEQENRDLRDNHKRLGTCTMGDIFEYSKLYGSKTVWYSCKNKMPAQGIEIKPHQLEWDTLPVSDVILDEQVVWAVVIDFYNFLMRRSSE